MEPGWPRSGCPATNIWKVAGDRKHPANMPTSWAANMACNDSMTIGHTMIRQQQEVGKFLRKQQFDPN